MTDSFTANFPAKCGDGFLYLTQYLISDCKKNFFVEFFIGMIGNFFKFIDVCYVRTYTKFFNHL